MVGETPMITFNNTYTAAVAGNQAYLNCISAAENFISSNWTNSITLNITWDAQNAGTNTFLASNSWPAFVNASVTRPCGARLRPMQTIRMRRQPSPASPLPTRPFHTQAAIFGLCP